MTLVNSLGNGSTRDVMRFRVARKAKDDSAVPGRLSDWRIRRPSTESGAVATRSFASA